MNALAEYCVLRTYSFQVYSPPRRIRGLKLDTVGLPVFSVPRPKCMSGWWSPLWQFLSVVSGLLFPSLRSPFSKVPSLYTLYPIPYFLFCLLLSPYSSIYQEPAKAGTTNLSFPYPIPYTLFPVFVSCYFCTKRPKFTAYENKQTAQHRRRYPDK